MELLSTEYIRYTYRTRVHYARRLCISSRSISDESDKIEGVDGLKFEGINGLCGVTGENTHVVRCVV